MANNPTNAQNDMNQAAKDVKDAAQDTAKDVKHGVNKLADDAKDAWNEATGNTNADKIKSVAADVANTAKERGAEYVDRAKSEADRLYREGERRAHEVAEYAGDYYDEMSDMVRRKPAQALGIAAGIGFLVGLILARR
ncbi:MULTISPECIES: YqjD family protein [unclassified Paracoccus (in: a-proteobacteria)]|uniref:DUF883 family protein n=1 Tax=unclassified Paracoccus (in: a-proteobacteria) TaxID=2688777 RepID=UPI0016043D61|nr:MULTISPECIES: DUF883 family protein [unclassified Paracoccus (in: a-proteobacteria)]MBB1491827.1 DUF883 domain-containing protein [Paracoccus sp. MC1854]MBB1496923.1 DUF883 domain-containing protein [Paracoccus sp. MC1862]QQO45544.1 DUF883 domain-containing protein [Paracoccus sp. MC1862]